MKSKLLTILISTSILATGCSQVKTNNNAENSVPNTTEKEKLQKAAETKEYTFKDGKAQLTDLDLTITKYKVIPEGESGNEYNKAPIIVFYYDVNNKSDKEISPASAWMAVFSGTDSVVQDNDKNKINKLELATFNDKETKQDTFATIKKGGTLSATTAYKLTDLTTPVVLKAYKGFSGELLGVQEFKID